MVIHHHLNRIFEVEAFSRPHAVLQRNGIQLFLRIHRQVHAFWQILANQVVDVSVASTLTWAERVCNDHLVSAHPKLLMPGVLEVPIAQGLMWP